MANYHKNAVFVMKFDHKGFEIILLSRLTRNFLTAMNNIKMEIVERESQCPGLILTNRDNKNNIQHLEDLEAVLEHG